MNHLSHLHIYLLLDLLHQEVTLVNLHPFLELRLRDRIFTTKVVGKRILSLLRLRQDIHDELLRSISRPFILVFHAPYLGIQTRQNALELQTHILQKLLQLFQVQKTSWVYSSLTFFAFFLNRHRLLFAFLLDRLQLLWLLFWTLIDQDQGG